MCFIRAERDPELTHYVACCRYFTLNHIAQDDVAEVLGHDLDPLSILERAVGSRGKHTLDNKVDYYRFEPTGNTDA